MKRRALIVAVLEAGLFAAAVYYAAIITIHRLSAVAELFYDNTAVLSVLDRLVSARVTPPLWLPLLCGFAAAMLIFSAFTDKKRGFKAVMIKTAAVFGVLLITVSAYAGTLYFTEVNGVPVHTAGKIIAGIIESGIIG